MTGEQIPSCWEDFAPFFADFERCGADLSVKDAYIKACASKLQIWGLQDDTKIHGLVSTEIIATAHGLVCVITMAYGTGPEESKHELMDAILLWAKETGCSRLRIQGRPGWLRWDRRFKPTGIIAEIDLCPA